MKHWITPQNVLILVLCIMVGFFYFDRKAQDKVQREYWENPNFKTDSIKAYIDYDKMPKPEYVNYVPPAIVINYIDSTKRYSSIQVVKNDSLLLIIDSLRDELTTISLNYLKNNPQAWKLIYGEFDKDTFRIDMVNLKGFTVTQKYGVNYDRFKYQYLYANGTPQFRADRIPYKDKVKSSLTHSFFASGGYLLTQSAPTIGLDYNIGYRDFRFRADGSLLIQEQPQLFFKVDLGYKIW